jgi:hypothetical protein
MDERQTQHQRTHDDDQVWHGELAVGGAGDMQRLHALSGVDASKWRICGLDIRFSYGEPTRVGVFAVERQRLAEADHDWSRLAKDHESVVPVTEFALPATRGAEILELFPDLSLVAARASAVERDGVELKVVEQVIPAVS